MPSIQDGQPAQSWCIVLLDTNRDADEKLVPLDKSGADREGKTLDPRFDSDSLRLGRG